MHFCVRKYFIQFFQKERSDNIFLYQSKNNDESFSYPAASKNEGLRVRSRCGRLSTAPKSAVGGRALFRKKRPSRLKRLGKTPGPPSGRPRSSLPEPGKPAQSACRRRACRISPHRYSKTSRRRLRLPMKERSPQPEQHPPRGARPPPKKPGRPATLRSRRPDDGQKNGTLRQTKHPADGKQWREAERRFGLT